MTLDRLDGLPTGTAYLAPGRRLDDEAVGGAPWGQIETVARADAPAGSVPEAALMLG